MTSNSTDDRQEQKVPNRRLEHLPDITSGTAFTAVPQKLMAQWIDGKMPDSKFKLLCVMLTHSKDFRIWSRYLRKRFCQKTLSKYLPELESEGYIETQKIRNADGSQSKIYHVRSVEYWECYREEHPSKSSDLGGEDHHGLDHHGLRHHITKSTENKINVNNLTHDSSVAVDNSEPAQTDSPKPTASGETKKKVSKDKKPKKLTQRAVIGSLQRLVTYANDNMAKSFIEECKEKGFSLYEINDTLKTQIDANWHYPKLERKIELGLIEAMKEARSIRIEQELGDIPF